MNLSGEDNTTFQLLDVNVTEQLQQPLRNYRDALRMLRYIMVYVCVVLGVPGNILSAIIWLRRHVTSKNSSALYLAVLAISDLIHLIVIFLLEARRLLVVWLHYCLITVYTTTQILEPLLVLSFSVERLIAISCPLQVRCICMCIICLYDCVDSLLCLHLRLVVSNSSTIIVSYHWQTPMCSKRMVGGLPLQLTANACKHYYNPWHQQWPTFLRSTLTELVESMDDALFKRIKHNPNHNY